MENVINEQTEPKAQTATAEQSVGETAEEVSLGKFKDVNALLSAYNSLQSEFTKRCQKIKELEAALVENDKENIPDIKENAPILTEKESELPKADITDKEKEQILRDYLLKVVDKKQKAVLLDGVGVGVKTPILHPKTIADAGELAREILKKQN